MSQAFVKEESGGRWEPPRAAKLYRLTLKAEQISLHETDDLLEALHWLSEREHGTYELRDQEGRLLACA